MTTSTALPTSRELPPEEFHRITEVEGSPLYAQPLPDPTHTRILAVEVEGQVIAYWGLYDSLHAEPVWIHPDHRQRPAVVRLLLEGLGQILQDLGATFVFGIIADGDMEKNLPLAQRLGFTELPGKLYGVQVKPNGGA